MKGNFIEGKRVYLRPFEDSDIERWFRWFNDPKVVYFMDKGRFPNTRKKQIEYLRSMNDSASDIQLAVVYKKGDRLVGTVGLHQIDLVNRNADISIIIGDQSYWSKGLGREAVRLLIDHAFAALNLHKLTAGMAEGNKASHRLFAGLGFKKEGVLKEHLYLRGEYCDVFRLGLVRKAGR